MTISLTAEYESAWNTTTTPKTISVTTLVGDVLVCCGLADWGGAGLSTPTGGTSLTWTLKQSETGSWSGLWLWTATAATSETFTFSLARAGGAAQYGFNVLRFSGSNGIGATNKFSNTGGSGTPSVSLTTTQANSAVVVANSDYAFRSGASRVWLTSAGAITEQSYSLSATYGAYVAWHPTVGAVGAKTLGLSAPTSQTYVVGAVEVKAIPDPIGELVFKQQAVNRSYFY